MMSQVLDTKASSPATEKLENQDKFQVRDKSYLKNVTESEAEPLKDGSAASIANLKAVLR